MGQIVTFEDNGQDFLRWLIKDGEVVDSDLQAWVWNGTKVTAPPAIGEHLQITTKGGDKTTINYKVIAIEEVSDDVTCKECGLEQPDAGRGVKCEECGGSLDDGVRVS